MENLIAKYFDEMKAICDTISHESISDVIDLLFNAWERKKKVFIMGNGGSASTAAHFVCDLNKVTIVDGKKRFRAIGLTDNIPWNSALVNDEGFENIFVEQLKNLYDPGDVLVGISVHGGSGQDRAGLWSQNLLKAMQYVNDHQGKTIGLSGFDGGAMKDIAHACIVVPYESTPHVESFHLALEHLITNSLKERILHAET